MKKTIPTLVAVLMVVSAVALAVKPAVWNQSAEPDFAAGKTESAVITSLGEVMLARALTPLLAAREDLGMISAIALDDKGRVCIGTAPAATVYRLDGGKLDKLATLPGMMVRTLNFADGKIVAGVCGQNVAGLYRIDAAGEVATLWADPEVTFVWAVAPDGKGGYFVATGGKGRVYAVGADGKAAVVYQSEEKNIMCLAAGKDGLLYAGTSDTGLILEINPAKATGRVLYDPPEKEIACLLVGPDGAVYAGTSDVSKAPSADTPVPVPAAPKPEPAAPAGAPGKASTTGAAVPAEFASVVSGATAAEAAAVAALPAAIPLATSAPTSAPTSTPAAVVTPGAPAGKTPIPLATQPAGTAVRTATPAAAGGGSASGGIAESAGNAVYRIDAQGFVKTIFRKPVSILAMTLHDDVLTLGTGHNGQLFAVDTAGERVTALAQVDPKDITALAADAAGSVYFATTKNPAVFALAPGYAAKGVFTSTPCDAKQVAKWGTISARVKSPAGTSATLATRTGNVTKPDDKTWSPWSEELPASGKWAAIASPVARYIQYRLTLTGKGDATPTVEQVQVVYQVGNLAPLIGTVQVTPVAKPGAAPAKRPGGADDDEPLRYRTVAFQASDPNDDALKYTLEFRKVGNQKWIKLTDKLTDPTYAWDTLGTEDGTYELQITASDAPANPPETALTATKLHRPVLVDNTAPTISDLAAKLGAKGEVELSASVADAASRLKRLDYSVDTNDDWVTVLPNGGLCDNAKESFAVTIKDLAAGAHRLAVRAYDEFNNVAYASVEVTIGK